MYMYSNIFPCIYRCIYKLSPHHVVSGVLVPLAGVAELAPGARAPHQPHHHLPRNKKVTTPLYENK